MKRDILVDLIEWKNSSNRKPLILTGVRQCGKTWALEKIFGEEEYENIALFDFFQNPEFHQFFETTRDPKRILENLMFASGKTIEPQKTLIIFDEIQECPNAISSLKYFYDEMPEYHIACAGSLLGVALNRGSSFPVGKVNFIDMHPMTFKEFLVADQGGDLIDYLENIEGIENVPDAFFNVLLEKLKMYFVTGGMPESVSAWVDGRSIEQVQKVLSEILRAYEADFAKHAEKKDIKKINLIWQTLPSQLSRENKKFMYKVAKEGARGREYEDALQWLVDAHLVNRVYRTAAPLLPQSAYEDLQAFKLYAVDLGLLRRLSLLLPSAFSEGDRLFTEFKGALTENYICQALTPQFEGDLHYWSDDKSQGEVDFVAQLDNSIIPIEVKSSRNINSTSLKRIAKEYPNEIKLRVRFSTANLQLDDNVLNIPLFLADYASKLISLALKK